MEDDLAAWDAMRADYRRNFEAEIELAKANSKEVRPFEVVPGFDPLADEIFALFTTFTPYRLYDHQFRLPSTNTHAEGMRAGSDAEFSVYTATEAYHAIESIRILWNTERSKLQMAHAMQASRLLDLGRARGAALGGDCARRWPGDGSGPVLRDRAACGDQQRRCRRSSEDRFRGHDACGDRHPDETFRPAFAMTSDVDLRRVAGPVRMAR